MRKEHQKPFVIFALNAGNVHFEIDIIRAAGIRREQIKPLRGVYTRSDGHKSGENSYLIVYDNEQQRADIIALAKKFDQESLLFVHSDRLADRYYTADKRIEHLSQFTEVSEITAKQQRAYTHDPSTGLFYIC